MSRFSVYDMTFLIKNKKKKNKFILLVLPMIIIGSTFFLDVSSASAGFWEGVDTATNRILEHSPLNAPGRFIVDQAGGVSGVQDFFVNGIKYILYSIFVVFGWLTSAAVTLFGWATDPRYIGSGGMLDRASVYQAWQFVRDFFNLFFILVLLLVAFSTIFQIDKYSYKKMLLSILLAALFINFSFPISRFFIDVANVPMYFFTNQMMINHDKPGEILGTALTATRIENILLPNHNKESVTSFEVEQLIAAIVFLALFSIALVVLAIMFVVRLAALLILVVLSPVGFAASIVPGLEKYASQWWENFWKYALFGPVAMFLLLIATRFFAEISEDQTFITFKNTAENYSVPWQNSFIASMAMFTVPMVILWFVIGLASTMSLAGAGAIVGRGKGAAKWMAKKSYNNPLTNNAWTRGTAAGLKERAEGNKVTKWVMPQTYKDLSKKKEEQYKGYAADGKAGKARVIENQHNKAVAEEEKKMEEARASESQLQDIMRNPTLHSKEKVEAAVRLLSKKDALRNDGDMAMAINAINVANDGNTPQAQAAREEKARELIKKAGGEIYQTGEGLAQAIAMLGNDTKAISALIDKAGKDALQSMQQATYDSIGNSIDPNMDPATRQRTIDSIKGKLDGKMKKEGAIGNIIRKEMANNNLTHDQAVAKIMASMNPADAAKVFKDRDQNIRAAAQNYLNSLQGPNGNRERYQKIRADI